ncbi:MAG: hypothetical protein WD651_10800 [Acidimicrobiia bacterium]
MKTSWRTALLLGACLLIIACGPNPLAGVGEGASDWIGEPVVSTLPVANDNGSGLVATREADWYNENLSEVPGTTPNEIIAGVFARSSPQDRFAQATPAEIAAALPDLWFPAALPPEVGYITSQLVYDRSTGQLATDQAAAFGLWIVEPYTRSRSVGQQGILTVAIDPAGADLMASGAGDTSCSRYSSFGGECVESEVEDTPAWALSDQSGITLIWFKGDFRYELFLRVGVDPDLALEMAESARPLGNLIE